MTGKEQAKDMERCENCGYVWPVAWFREVRREKPWVYTWCDMCNKSEDEAGFRRGLLTAWHIVREENDRVEYESSSAEVLKRLEALLYKDT